MPVQCARLSCPVLLFTFLSSAVVASFSPFLLEKIKLDYSDSLSRLV